MNRATPRLVDALPNGPRNHPTVHVFMAGGVPEVMLHLRRMGLLNQDVVTVTGERLSTVLDWWEASDRRRAARDRLRSTDGVDPDDVIMTRSGTPAWCDEHARVRDRERRAGGFGDQSHRDRSGGDRCGRGVPARGPARVFTSEVDAIKAVKGLTDTPVRANDVLVLIGGGPMGTGMEETYQLTAALKYLPWGPRVAVLTDARFSGVSTGACIGHVGPEALAGGPIGKLRDGDEVEIVIDRATLEGRVNLVAVEGRELSADEASGLLRERGPHPGLRPHPALPGDTRLWAALQQASGGTWGGAVYDVDRIIETLEAGRRAISSGE